MIDTVYMLLVDDGTNAWRPVRATGLANGDHVILGIVPNGETWAFPSGSNVRCELRRLSNDAECLVPMFRTD